MIFDITRAQSSIWSKLLNISKSKRIGNAYLFSGQSGAGKEAIAIKFAQLINCKESVLDTCNVCSSCLQFRTLQHERLNIIVPLPSQKASTIKNSFPKEYYDSLDEKSKDPYYKIHIPKSNRILVQSIRGLKKKLYFKHEEGTGRSIVIIFDSELLCSGQGESGNALLKLLEEPPEKTTFILVTDHKNMLFETIISRCQNINIPPLNNDFVRHWLIRKQLNQEEVNFIVSICRGNIHNARLLSSQSTDNTMNIIERLTTTVIGKSTQKWRYFISYYSRLFNTNQLDFDYHLNLIIIWLQGANRLKQGLVSGFEKTRLHKRIISFNEKFPKANIFNIILCIEEVKSHARQNFYMPIILLNMLLDIQKFANE